MTYLTGKRLTQDIVQLDIDGLRRGFYSDKYFHNIVHVMEGLRATGYTFVGKHGRSLPTTMPVTIGDLIVEVQIFNRREPRAIIAGVDAALVMLRHATGYFESDNFVPTWQHLEVDAVHDGVMTDYDANPLNVCPVIKIRGRYRDFALLETPILGVLTHASRIATNVYDTLEVSNGKPILFFPARFDLPQSQAVDGYAYWVAVQRYNAMYGKDTVASVSTDAQGAWWGGHGSGTIPHALIAAFMGDTAETMVAFAEHTPITTPRIALVDFNNDTVGDSIKTLDAFWERYRVAFAANDREGMRRWTLDGVRIDTSPAVRDVSLKEGDPFGISPVLIRTVRDALDNAWRKWVLPEGMAEIAQAYCRSVKIVATGGFSRERIIEYEAANVPVDVYGVGSRFLRNDSTTNTDFTMDIVRVQVDGQWIDMAKIGRRGNENPELQPVDLSAL